MTANEWIKANEARLEAILTEGKPMELAVRSVMALQSRRIFQDGKNTAGTGIGQYNTTRELWAYDERSPKKVTGKGKTGKDIKGGYYESYKKYREQQGREDGFVNLRLTNELQNDFNNAETGNPPQPDKVSSTEYVIRLKKDINQKKREGIEAKYGEVFLASAEEIKRFNEILQLELFKALLK